MPLASGQNESFSAPSPLLNAPLIPSPLDGKTPTCEACGIAGVGALDPPGPSFCPGKKGSPDRGQGGQSSSQILASAPQKLEEDQAGSLPLAPKCPHTQVPNDSSVCSQGVLRSLMGETAGPGDFYLQIQIKQILLKCASLPNCFPPPTSVPIPVLYI